MDLIESDEEGSVNSLDGTLRMEVSGSSSSMQKYKHLYPEPCVFQHDEIMEKKMTWHILPLLFN